MRRMGLQRLRRQAAPSTHRFTGPNFARYCGPGRPTPHPRSPRARRWRRCWPWTRPRTSERSPGASRSHRGTISAEVIDTAGDVREQVADRRAAGPVPAEPPRRREQVSGPGERHPRSGEGGSRAAGAKDDEGHPFEACRRVLRPAPIRLPRQPRHLGRSCADDKRVVSTLRPGASSRPPPARRQG